MKVAEVITDDGLTVSFEQTAEALEEMRQTALALGRIWDGLAQKGSPLAPLARRIWVEFGLWYHQACQGFGE